MALSCSKLNSTQLAVISAVIVVIGDIIAVIATITALREEKQGSSSSQVSAKQ